MARLKAREVRFEFFEKEDEREKTEFKNEKAKQGTR